jgi:hypothetical protein
MRTNYTAADRKNWKLAGREQKKRRNLKRFVPEAYTLETAQVHLATLQRQAVFNPAFAAVYEQKQEQIYAQFPHLRQTA